MVKHRWIVILQTDPRPLYLQIIEQIQRRVAVGDLAPGPELPSLRHLAAELQISVITIKRAYLELEREGVIATRQGKGSVVSERPRKQSAIQTRELEAHLAGAADLGILLGLSKTELQSRLADAIKRVQKKKS